MKFHVGIDLGGTKIEIVILDQSFNQLFRERTNTEAFNGNDHIISKIMKLYKNALIFIGNEEHTLGVGTPSSICKKTGNIINSTISPHNGIKLDKILQNRLEHNLVLENDANCFVIAESKLGAAKNYNFIFGVIIGTGCGGGIIFNNTLWRGKNGLSGEWGHSSIDLNGDNCFCGNKGCINTLISGSALEKIIYKKLKKNISAKKFLNKKVYTIEEQYIIDLFHKNLKLSFLNIIKVLDPEVIIVGGGLSNYDPLYENFLIDKEINTPIIKNQLGDSSGVIGAALLGIN